MADDPKLLDPPETQEPPQPEEESPQIFAVSRDGGDKDPHFNRRSFLTMAGVAAAGLAVVATGHETVSAKPLPAGVCRLTPKGSNINMRTGPGTEYGKAGKLVSGQEYPIIAKAKDTKGFYWWKFTITTLAAGYAWVSVAYVTTIGDCSATPIVDAPPKAQPTAGPVSPGMTGAQLTINGTVYSLPCGSPIPANAVCVCNCVTVPAPTQAPSCGCVGHQTGNCSCDQVCTCNTIHYWYPN